MSQKVAIDIFALKLISFWQEKICSSLDNKVNIAKYKNQLGMVAGTTDVKLESTHDTGKSCIEINFTMSKEKRAG